MPICNQNSDSIESPLQPVLRIAALANARGSGEFNVTMLRQRPSIAIHDARRLGVTHLLVYCTNTAVHCHHGGSIPIADLHDDLPMRSLEPRCRCTKCGKLGADVRPDYSAFYERRT